MFQQWIQHMDGLDKVVLTPIFWVALFSVGVPSMFWLFGMVAQLFGLFIGTVVARILPLQSQVEIKPMEPVTYSRKRTERVYRPVNADGTANMPNHDKVRVKYQEANYEHPPMDSVRYRKAQALDMRYFVSPKYPFNYIVFGDRAAIEEARKGAFLTHEEKQLILLGYGYDGLPFGELWGIADECLEEFEYAIAQHDFISWSGEPNGKVQFLAFIKAGYGPFELYQRFNRDLLAELEVERKENGERITQRLSRKVLLDGLSDKSVNRAYHPTTPLFSQK